ncbi:hypothetical protein Trihar35433_9091 [Trichoderma harzianum]|nr:hypothetical protein Trihar35433_9091 [Trichoderma harzianum]
MRCDTMRYSGGRYRIPAAPARLASLSSSSRACTACTSRLVSYHVPPLHSPHLTSRTPPARASTCTLYSRCWPAHWPAAKARRNEWLVQEGARAIGRPTRERIAAADWLQPEPQQFPAVVSGFISFYRKLLTGGTSTNTGATEQSPRVVCLSVLAEGTVTVLPLYELPEGSMGRTGRAKGSSRSLAVCAAWTRLKVVVLSTASAGPCAAQPAAVSRYARCDDARHSKPDTMRCATPRHASHSAAVRHEPAPRTATPLCAPASMAPLEMCISTPPSPQLCVRQKYRIQASPHAPL